MLTLRWKLLISLRDQLVLNIVDLKTRHIVFLNMLGLQLQLPRDLSLPNGTTQERLVKVARPTPTSPIKIEDRPVQAQDLANFKNGMTSLI